VSRLADQQCVPCRGGVPPLGAERIEELLREIEPGWELVRTGAMAEEQGHHPDLQLAWGKVVVEIWTHKIDGLTESDFIFAAKCDRLFAA
jgi:4a-hydroxytetrahydrobiopterin dehydratase